MIGRRGTALCSVAGLCVALTAVANADTTTIEGGLAPVVRITLPQATLTVKTWDREAVQIEADPGALSVERKSGRFSAGSAPVLIRMARVQRGDGEIVLPAESFVVSSLTAGDHDIVRITAAAGRKTLGSVTITVPSDTAVLAATVDRGSVGLRDYRLGTFILHVRSGQAQLQNVGGDGFVQVLQGGVTASDSSFDRLRVRTAIGSQIYQRCRAKQIEAWSAEGSVVYDSGTFSPGLARFESTDGNVAIGVNGGTQLAGSTGNGGGKIYTLFDRATQVDGRGGEANANYAGGGPLVNAFSASGSVYLYDGGLAVKRKLPPEWRPVLLTLRNESAAAAQVPRRDHPDAQASSAPIVPMHPLRRPRPLPESGRAPGVRP